MATTAVIVLPLADQLLKQVLKVADEITGSADAKVSQAHAQHREAVQPEEPGLW